MARTRKTSQPRITLSEALNFLTVDQLKELIALLPETTKPTRKAELVAGLEHHLSGKPLRELWSSLDDTQQLAVRETLYSPDGRFDATRFRAKYGTMPNLGTRTGRWSSQIKPSRLRLFLYSEHRYSNEAAIIPVDLQERLRAFVPRPAPPTLPSVDAPPESVEQREDTYELDDDDAGIIVMAGKTVYRMPTKPPRVETTVHQVPLTRRDMERAAQQDLLTVLRLIDRGKVAVSAKTLQASAATIQSIAEVLCDGDFFDPAPKKRAWEQTVGPIRAFAWSWLVQAAKLGELRGTKLALTKAGRAALGAPPARTLRQLWQRWLKNTVLDEFSRIDIIKGQRGRGKRSMTAASSRRPVIAEALKHCPVGRWVRFDDFSRFMQAAHYDFSITREPWDLYIEDANYGSLGHQGYHDWHVLQGRYLLCLLFEYAATLGLIDVAYTDPHGARRDYTELWGTDDLDFLSRYDGLQYFRLNALGAWCLGMAKTYAPSIPETRSALTILSNLRIEVTGETLSPDERLLLETYATAESDTVWRLDRDRALTALESGHQIRELREFLASRDDQPLPETVEGFLQHAERQAHALVPQGTALIFECADEELATLLATHKRTAKLCLRAGKKHLVVQAASEDAFRTAVHDLGYGMPKV